MPYGHLRVARTGLNVADRRSISKTLASVCRRFSPRCCRADSAAGDGQCGYLWKIQFLLFHCSTSKQPRPTEGAPCRRAPQ